MDDAQATDLNSAVGAVQRLQRVGGRVCCSKAAGVSPGGTAHSADLGGSSNDSTANVED